MRKTTLFLLLFFYITVATVAQRNFFYIAPSILFLLALPYLKTIKNYSRASLIVPAAILIYVFTEWILCVIHGERIAQIKENIPLLLTFPLIFMVAKQQLSFTFVARIFAAASAVLGVIAVYDRYFLNLPRALIERQPIIPAGGVAMTLGIFCLFCVFAAIDQNKLKTAALYLMAGLGGILCSILTGSRGTWLCLPPILLWLVWQYRHSVRSGVWILTGVVTALAVLILLPESGMMVRIMEGYTNLQQYFSGENRDTSLGLRLQFWQSAWDGFLQKPLLGWGEENYYALKHAQYVQGMISEQAVTFTHAHNQFLDYAVKQGLLGVAALLLLLLSSWRFFYRIAHTAKTQNQRNAAQCGQILLFCTLTFCLSDVFLSLQLGMVFFAVTLTLFTGMCLQESKNV